jgi:N-acetylglucosamine-6-phosphate deacetylase
MNNTGLNECKADSGVAKLASLVRRSKLCYSRRSPGKELFVARKSRYLLRGRIAGQENVSDIVVRDGKVEVVRSAGRGAADFGGPDAILSPTLFDIQVNGVQGIDLQSPDLDVEQVRAMHGYLVRHGVCRWIPTLVTGALETMEHGCQVLAEAMIDPELKKAIPGIHLEGPFLSPKDGPRGAHPAEYIRPPRLREFNRLLKASRGNVRYVTVAPELPGMLRCIQGMIMQGVRVSLGHHEGNAEQIRRAVEAGACLSTHLGNGSAPQMHRQHNHLWPQLAEDRLYASFIADLHHLPASALKTFIRAKTPARSVLVSDCVHLTGLPAGRYKFMGAKVSLLESGKICLVGTDLLAGSGLHLLEGVVNTWSVGAMTLAEALHSASAVPAQCLGLPAPPPMTRKGRKANLMVFSVDKSSRPWRTTMEAVFDQGTLVLP